MHLVAVLLGVIRRIFGYQLSIAGHIYDSLLYAQPCSLSFSAFSPQCSVPNIAITSGLSAESITLPNAMPYEPYRGRLRIPQQSYPEVMAMEFWDAYYLEKIQEMKAQRKAELEEAGKL